MQHLVLTRIGLGCFNGEWYRRMVDLFEAVTFLSLANQTCQDFHFLVVVDAALQNEPRRKLEALTARQSNFHLVNTDITRMTSMRMGGHDWIYEPCKAHILANRLIADPSEYIITSIIDADDAWNRDYVLKINRLVLDNIEKIHAAEAAQINSHVRHSAGLVHTYPNGLKWFPHVSQAAPMHFPYASSSASVVARFSSGISALSCRHAAWPQLLSILMFKPIEEETPEPMWLHVRHDLTTQPWDIKHFDQTRNYPDKEIERLFGVDTALLAKSTAVARDPAKKQHDGKPSRHQYDRIFQLTALNYQIECLDRETAQPDGCVSDLHKTLQVQREKREQLLAEIRAAGISDYS